MALQTKETLDRKDRKEAIALVDDEDLPEEVTLEEGREEAIRLKREEKDSQRRIVAEAKLRRRLRSASKNLGIQDKTTDIPVEGSDDAVTSPKEAVSLEKDATLNEELKPDQGHNSDLDAIEPESTQLERCSTLLDDNIVQYLETREKRMRTAIFDASDKKKKIKTKFAKKSRQYKVDYDDGTNRVELLTPNYKPISYQTQAAMEFRKDQLYGINVQRSYSMLSRSKAS